MKLKGDANYLTGRGMLEAVEKTKNDHMASFLNRLPAGNLMDEEMSHMIETRSDLSVPNIVKLKLLPDKFALNSEELQHLLSADQLSLNNGFIQHSDELNEPSPNNQNR